MVTFDIPPGKILSIPDGGRWLLVYHDGDEESHVRIGDDGFFQLGPTSGDWQVASDGGGTSRHPVADLAA